MQVKGLLHVERARQRMTMQEIADGAGISRSTVWRIENGGIEVASFGTVVRIAKSLGCEVTDLYEVEQ